MTENDIEMQVMATGQGPGVDQGLNSTNHMPGGGGSRNR